VDAARFLVALGKDSVTNERVEGYIAEEKERKKTVAEQGKRHHLLGGILDTELPNPASPLVAAICEHLKNREGLGTINSDDVCANFRQYQTPRQTDLPSQEGKDSPQSLDPGTQLLCDYWKEFTGHAQRKNLPLFAGAAIKVVSGKENNVNLDLEEKGFAEKDCYLWFKLGPKRYLAGLWVMTESEKPSPKVYEFLVSRKAAIEKALGLRMNWDLWNLEQGIVYKGALAKKDLSDRANWPRLMEEMIDVMTRIHAAFAPHIQGMPKA